MKRVKSYLLVLMLTAAVVISPVLLKGNDVAAQGDTNIVVTVSPSSTDPKMTIVKPSDGAVVNEREIDIVLHIENIMDVEVWVDGVLVCTETNISVAFYVMTCDGVLIGDRVGEHEIIVIGTRDGNGATISERAEVKFEYKSSYAPPNAGTGGTGLPDTGFLRIGELTVAKNDYVASCIVMVTAVIGLIGFWFMRRDKERDEVVVRVEKKKTAYRRKR